MSCCIDRFKRSLDRGLDVGREVGVISGLKRLIGILFDPSFRPFFKKIPAGTQNGGSCLFFLADKLSSHSLHRNARDLPSPVFRALDAPQRFNPRNFHAMKYFGRGGHTVMHAESTNSNRNSNRSRIKIRVRTTNCRCRYCPHLSAIYVSDR